jgi:hypothetical protein
MADASRRGFMLHIPGGEHENGRVTPQRTSENFCPLYTEVHPIPLDGRDGGLRDASELRQLVLAQLLELTHDPDGIPDRDTYPLSGTLRLHNLLPPIVVQSNPHYLNAYGFSQYSIKHSVLLVQPGRSVTSPVSRKRFVIESTYLPQPGWPGNSHHILPLFVAFQDLDRKPIELLRGRPAFEDFPHEL